MERYFSEALSTLVSNGTQCQNLSERFSCEVFVSRAVIKIMQEITQWAVAELEDSLEAPF